jgi:hypothetical protein
MLINIKKCGYQGISETPPTIEGEAVPVTTTYKYLGFPHKRDGIDFDELLKQNSLKTNRLLRFILCIGRGWTIPIKLGIIRAFARPVLEFGFQLAHHSFRIDWKPAESIWDACLKFILPMAPHPRIAGGILALPTMQERAEGLAASFCQHVSRMAHDHPVRIVSTLLDELGFFPRRLGHRIPQTRLYRRLSSEISPKTRFPCLLRKWYLQKALQRSLSGRYIHSKSRVRQLGPDKSIFLPADVANDALAWRCGSLGNRRKCPSGLHQFNRACPNQCLSNILPPLEHFNRKPNDAPRHYGRIDEYLNHGNIAGFMSVIAAIFGPSTNTLS